MASSGGPDGINNGLVFALDAANKISYTGTGTSWYNLVYNNVGTLTNGPTFNGTNGGSIVFDGVDDYVTVPYSSTWSVSAATYEIWIKKSSAGVSG